MEVTPTAEEYKYRPLRVQRTAHTLLLAVQQILAQILLSLFWEFQLHIANSERVLGATDLRLPIAAEAFRQALKGLLHVDALKEKLGALAKIPTIFVGQSEIGQRVALEGEDLGEGFEPLVLVTLLREGVSARRVQFLILTKR